MHERLATRRRSEDMTESSVLDSVIDEGARGLEACQQADGHWVFELEADATIPSEYILLNHFLGEIDPAVEAEIAAFLRQRQGEHGGWPLFHDGDIDLSATVKAYFALKLVGDSPADAHMRRARDAILARGGAARANVFTRISLALFGQVPWRATPVMRIEAMLAPKWFPFHFSKVSYWSRTVMIPLLILALVKPRASNPRAVGVEELFTTPPDQERHYFRNPTGHWLGAVMLAVDRIVRALEPAFPRALERRALDKAIAFVTERLNGDYGIGGIFPAMANALMAFHALGYDREHPSVIATRKAIDGLVVRKPDGGTYCQPCSSPVWDTGLAVHAMLEVGREDAALAATDWLQARQIRDVAGDWTLRRRNLTPGGWAFQYRNDHYPDVDDTAVVIMALQRADPERYAEAIALGADWIVGMQSRNGGWGSFDADNAYGLLEHIPFADHGALLDPPTADVTARCTSMLAQLGYDRGHGVMNRALAFLMHEQEDDGSWFGRWGTNFIYGTWSVLAAFNAAGEDMDAPHVRKAVEWIKSRQREDGGWGEDCASYWQDRRGEAKASTPSQTAWAVLGLMAVGEAAGEHAARGIDYLIGAERKDGVWDEQYFNAVGFPRVFYLRYHGYSAYFPLLALARYRNLTAGGARFPTYGF
ncbi:MAG: squalene--hopene cyclase [Rhodospirillales bacterium]|nr:squalene--hopene cyclase [Rhodospirillales bacterium]